MNAKSSSRPTRSSRLRTPPAERGRTTTASRQTQSNDRTTARGHQGRLLKAEAGQDANKQDAVDHQRLVGKTAQKPAQAQGNHPTYGQAHKGQGPKAPGNTTEPHAKSCNGTATRKQQQ